MTHKTAEADSARPRSRTESMSDPIQFILQDHDRQLEICSGLEKLVSASETEPVGDWAATLLFFLTRDLPRHVLDEEQDLFPCLRARQPSESYLDDILDQLTIEHEADKELVELVIKGLRAIAEGTDPEHPTRFQWNVRAFCEMQRRHLNWENHVVLPMAEKLLTADDRQALARRMIARRNKFEGA